MFVPRSSEGVSPFMETAVLTYLELARATGLTTRTLRQYVREGAIEPPAIEYVPGTFRFRRVWPTSIVAKVEEVAACRRRR